MDVMRIGAQTTFAELLKRYREAAGLTQEALADGAGLSARTISDLERGLKHTPRHDTLELLATALALSPEQTAAFRALARGYEDLPASPTAELRIARSVSPDLFISYAPGDRESVAHLTMGLHEHGITSWMGEPSLIAGTAGWEQAQRDVIRACQAVLLVASPNARTSRFVPDELRLAEVYQRSVFALWLSGDQWMECIPMGWGGVRAIDARGARYNAALAELAGMLGQHGRHVLRSPAAAEAEGAPRNPYKGLRAFRGADAGDFFGRDTLIATLLQSLRSSTTSGTPRFLAVIGPSGSGKSSVVMAGLIPRLQQGALPGSATWTYLEPLLPGTHPLEALTLTLSTAMPGSSLSSIRADLDDSPRGLHLLGRRIAGQAPTQVMLVIDQGEELFTLTSDEGERRHFIDLLVTAVTEPAGPLLVVLTLRADFYDRPMSYPALGALLETQGKSVLPMSLADLRQAIEKPATLPDVGLAFENDLIGDLLFEVRGQAGALPLLAFTLEQLFERRQGRCMTLAAYHELGGVQGALARHAEATYAGLPSYAHQWLARALFLRLIDPGATEQETTRRRAALGELLLPDAGQTACMRETADAFTAARLLVTNSAPAGRPASSGSAGTIEVSHEALIREWARLGEWLHEAREDIRLQQTISADAANWERHGRPADALYRGLLLDEATSWAERNAPSVIEINFINASIAERQRLELAARDQQARELDLARQAARASRRAAIRLGYLAIVLVVSLLVAGALALVARNNSATAIRERDIALSRLLAAQAISHLGGQYDLALLLGVEANRIADTVEARASLLSGLEYSPQLVAFLQRGTDAVTSIAYSPDGRILASSGCMQSDNQGRCTEGAIRLWDMERLQPLGSPLVLNGMGAIETVAFSPDGRTLAAGGHDGSIQLWNVARRVPLGPPLTGHTYSVNSVSFSPNGAILASGSADLTVRLWDVAHRQPLGPPIIGPSQAVTSVAFSPDGRTLAFASYDATIRLWDVAHGRPLNPPFAGQSGEINSIAFSPDGSMLASGSDDTTIQLWDIAHRQPLGPPITGHAASVTTVAFSPNGAILASGSDDLTIRLWDVARRQPLGPALTGCAGSITTVAFRPDGRALVSSSQDGTIRVWDIAGQRSLGLPLTGHTGSVYSVAFSPDGKTLASGSRDGSTRLWDIAHRLSFGSTSADRTSSVTSVAFSPDGTMLASGIQDGTIRLWNVVQRQPLGPLLSGHTGSVNSVAFSRDGKMLVSGSDDKTIRLWSVVQGRSLGAPLTGHTYGVTSVTFSPNGTTVASGSDDGTIRFWDAVQRRSLGPPLIGHTGGVTSVAFSPDGTILASASQDGTIRLWDVTRRQPLGPPLGDHTGSVYSVAFSPDGSMLASGSDDATIQLWDTAHRQPLGPPLTGHTGSVYSVAFSPDGKTLASSSYDQTVRLWDVDLASWKRQACRIANRNLTAQEWQLYLGDRPYEQTCPSVS